MYVKKLIGTQCYLSPLNLEDAEQYAVWLNDVEVIENLQLSSSIISVEGEREFLKKLAQEHNYGIIDLKTNHLLGNVGFIDINHLHRTAEIGIFIGERGTDKKPCRYCWIMHLKRSICIAFYYGYMTLISAPLPATKRSALNE